MARKVQRPRVAGGFEEQVLESGRRKVEEGEAVVADVVAV